MLQKRDCVQNARALTNCLGIVRIQAPFLVLLCIPLAIVSVPYAFGVSLTVGIGITVARDGFTQLLGLRSRTAHEVRGLANVMVAAGSMIGVVILLIQVFLRPGKASSGEMPWPDTDSKQEVKGMTPKARSATPKGSFV